MRVVKDRKGGNSQWEKRGHEGSEGQEGGNSQWEKGGHEGSEGQERRKLTVGEGRT